LQLPVDLRPSRSSLSMLNKKQSFQDRRTSSIWRSTPRSSWSLSSILPTEDISVFCSKIEFKCMSSRIALRWQKTESKMESSSFPSILWVQRSMKPPFGTNSEMYALTYIALFSRWESTMGLVKWNRSWVSRLWHWDWNLRRWCRSGTSIDP
jgi:hypothetical protein